MTQEMAPTRRQHPAPHGSLKAHNTSSSTGIIIDCATNSSSLQYKSRKNQFPVSAQSAAFINQVTMCSPSEPPSPAKQSCLESAGNAVDTSISSFFYRIGHFCCNRPKLTIGLALGISIVCAGGMAKLNSENRGEKLWVPQGTVAGAESEVR